MENDLKILVYDNHQLVTDAIQKYIKSSEGLVLTEICHSMSDVKNSLNKVQPDVIITDVLSDEHDGLSFFEFIHEQHSEIKIVAYTSMSNDFIIESLQQIGVSAVVNKKERISALMDVVISVYNDQKIPSKNTTEIILTLTKKEKEIAEYLAKGYSAKEIAIASKTSVNTINNQKNQMLEKFSCTNSTELVVKLAQIGLIKFF
jgi:DNA-binding NarL/FixJ family response regulator